MSNTKVEVQHLISAGLLTAGERLRPVNPQGGLGVASDSFPAELVVSTMEAVLIEGLEPPQNRRQGDGLKGQEYLQVLAPEIEHERLKYKMLEIFKQ